MPRLNLSALAWNIKALDLLWIVEWLCRNITCFWKQLSNREWILKAAFEVESSIGLEKYYYSYPDRVLLEKSDLVQPEIFLNFRPKRSSHQKSAHHSQAGLIQSVFISIWEEIIQTVNSRIFLLKSSKFSHRSKTQMKDSTYIDKMLLSHDVTLSGCGQNSVSNYYCS